MYFAAVATVTCIGHKAVWIVCPTIHFHYFKRMVSFWEIATPTLCGLGGTVNSDPYSPTREATEVLGGALHQREGASSLLDVALHGFVCHPTSAHHSVTRL